MSTVSSGSTAIVLSGQTLSNINVLSGGTLINGNVGSTYGGVVAGGTVFSGGTSIVGVGGTTLGGTVLKGGELDVLLSGTASNNVIYGLEAIKNAASPVSMLSFKDVVASGGTLMNGIVGNFYGGLASGSTVLSGGTSIVGVGGTTLGGTVLKGGELDVVLSGLSFKMSIGGAEIVYAGGTAFGDTVLSGGTILVQSGGTEVIASGSAVPGGTLLTGATLALTSGVYISGQSSAPGINYLIGSGATAVATTISSGATQLVQSGGTSLGMNLTSGGTLIEGPGTTLSIGSWSSGAVIVAPTLTVVNGLTIDYIGGPIYSFTVNGGGWLQTHAGAWGWQDTIQSGGTENLGWVGRYAGGVDFQTNVYGTQNVAAGGTTAAATVNNGGNITLSAGGVMSMGNILGGGTLVVSSGGVANNVTVSAGGTEIIASGSVVSGGTLLTGATLALTSGVYISGQSSAPGINYLIGSGATAVATTISSGATQSVQSGGTSLGMNLTSGGTLIEGPGATLSIGSWSSGAVIAAPTYIIYGGTAVNYIGGPIYSFTVNGGAWLRTYAGAWAWQDTIQSGGTENLGWVGQYAGGVDFQTNVNGTQDVAAGGTTVAATVNNGGNITLSAGGVMSMGNILGGGTLVVSSGGVANNVTVSAGGTEIIASGGVVSGGTLLTGATLARSVASSESHQISSDTTGPNAAGILTTKPSGGTEIVGAGEVARGRSGEAGTMALLTSGAFAANQSVGSGVTYQVGSGATALNTLGTRGAAVTVLCGGIEIASGGTASNVTVLSGGIVVSGAAATLTGLTLSSGGGIDFQQAQYTSGATAFVTSGGTLVLQEAGHTYQQVLAPGSYSPGAATTRQDAADGSTEVIVCFLAGTLIRMADGAERAVEEISIGDSVLTYDWRSGSERARPVSWVGRQRNTLRLGLPDDEAGYPVRVLAGALSEGVPAKDLLLTPEHSLFFEGSLVPVRMLVNGSSIFYDHTLTSYEFFHIETTEHSVIWANGALSESYLDTGNRRSFTQHGTVATLGGRHRSWAEDSAAPLEVRREVVEPLHGRLATRAAEQGVTERREAAQGTPVRTTDAALHLMTEDGRRIRQARERNGQVTFLLPADVSRVRIVSRCSRPADVVGPFVDDRRWLGVRIKDITISEGNRKRSFTGHLTATSDEGWHDLEWWSGGESRWTDGNALLDVGPRQRGVFMVLTLQVVDGGPYLVVNEDVTRPVVWMTGTYRR